MEALQNNENIFLVNLDKNATSKQNAAKHTKHFSPKKSNFFYFVNRDKTDKNSNISKKESKLSSRKKIRKKHGEFSLTKKNLEIDNLDGALEKRKRGATWKRQRRKGLGEMPKRTLEKENKRPHPVAKGFDLPCYETLNEDDINEISEGNKGNIHERSRCLRKLPEYYRYALVKMGTPIHQSVSNRFVYITIMGNPHALLRARIHLSAVSETSVFCNKSIDHSYNG